MLRSKFAVVVVLSAVILAQVRVGNYLIHLSFTAPEGTDDAPDARDVIAVATNRLIAAAS